MELVKVARIIPRIFRRDSDELEHERKIFAVSSGISRRSFLKTAGVLGSAILVAPSLIQLPADRPLWDLSTTCAKPGRFEGVQLHDRDAELRQIFREVYAGALDWMPTATPLMQELERRPRSLFVPRSARVFFSIKTG